MVLVNDIYATVQGEGVQTGVPMVLLRLHGCGVGCPWCDTKETWAIDPSQEEVLDGLDLTPILGANPRHARLSGTEIAVYIRQRFPSMHWVLVTGGEPADQDLRSLVAALHDAGYQVALETSGTATGHVHARFDWVCVSPKIDMPGGRQVLGPALAMANEIKHVVGTQQDIDRLDALLQEHAIILNSEVQVCLQPVSKSPKATQLCVETVQERGGWRLSIQTHKYLGLA